MTRTVRAGGLVALTVPALLALACESLLGIDGRYVDESRIASTGGAPAAGSGGSGGASGGWGSGGVTPETGGASGGTSPGGTGGAVAEDAGCDGACEPPGCRTGHYSGTFEGAHDPVNIPGVSLFQVSGTVELDVKADSEGRLRVSGDLTLHQQPQPSLLSQFDATIEGELDCETAKLDAKLTEGKLTPVLLPTTFAFEGALTGAYDSTTLSVTGDFSETQLPATQPTGIGKWKATWVRP